MEPDDMIERLNRVIDSAIASLMEHFETVQIFVSRVHPEFGGSTFSMTKGSGNWHARVGQVGEWLIQTQADAWTSQEIKTVRREFGNEEEEP